MARDKDPSLLVHLQKDECKAFDTLQGGIKVIPVDDEFSQRMHALGFPVQGQIRDYQPLAKVLQNPEIRKLFEEINEKIHSGEDEEQLNHFYQVGKEVEGKYHDIPENDPELKQLSDAGIEGDTEIAYMPLSVCNFLDKLRKEPPKTNPKTGFPEYGGLGNFINSIVRTVTTVVGAVAGGPFGAVAGNSLGRMVTGQKPGSAMMASLPNALYAMGAQGLGSAMGSYLPGAAGSFGNSIANMGGNLSTANMASGLGNMMGTASNSIPGMTAAGGAGNILSILGKVAPLAMTAYGVHSLNKGRKEEKSNYEQERERLAREKEEHRRHMGYYDSLDPLQETGNFEDEAKYYSDYAKKPSFKKGGLARPRMINIAKEDYVNHSQSFKGKSKGQQDNLKKDLPTKAYIIPADVVSMNGDGNTKAGQDLFKKFEKKVQSKYTGMRVNRKISKMKAMTSDGEYQVSPLTVTILGKGNNSHGAKMLDSALPAIRADKMRNGTQLQPKAHPFEYYLRNMRS